MTATLAWRLASLSSPRPEGSYSRELQGLARRLASLYSREVQG